MNSGGLIEALTSYVKASKRGWWFPPVNSGGLIEAFIIGLLLLWVMGCFRR